MSMGVFSWRRWGDFKFSTSEKEDVFAHKVFSHQSSSFWCLTMLDTWCPSYRAMKGVFIGLSKVSDLTPSLFEIHERSDLKSANRRCWIRAILALSDMNVGRRRPIDSDRKCTQVFKLQNRLRRERFSPSHRLSQMQTHRSSLVHEEIW